MTGYCPFLPAPSWAVTNKRYTVTTHRTTPSRQLRPARVAEKLDVSVPTVYRYVRTDPTFPRPVKLTPRTTVFDDAQLDAWIEGRRAAA